MSEVPPLNNPNELSVLDIAEYTLSQPGYQNYGQVEKARLLRKLGAEVLVTMDLDTDDVA